MMIVNNKLSLLSFKKTQTITHTHNTIINKLNIILYKCIYRYECI